MDRRKLIVGLAVAGTVILVLPTLFDVPYLMLLAIAFLIGGFANPLYSLLLAYVNDYLDHSDMAAASAGLIFVNGVGAISGPIVTGWIMGLIGPSGYFAFMLIVFAMLAGYGLWRMMQRRRTPDSLGSYAALSPTASVITVEAALELAEDDVDTTESSTQA